MPITRPDVMMVRTFLFLLLVINTAVGQSKLIEGKIIDTDTGLPIPFASIGLIGTSKGTSSNLNGQFSLSVQGTFSIRISCLGYETLELNNLPPNQLVLVSLKPSATQLKEIVILNRKVNARKVVRRAFAAISSNFNTEPFIERFFYRHYCKDDSVYGRLIEASVDVWKRKGYRGVQNSAGDKEEIRVTQLRRSFDKTQSAQGHVPIAVKSILEADIAGYQTALQREHLSYYSDVSNLKTDMDKYAFTFEGITTYDGKEVYEIAYSLRQDSVLTTAGYKLTPHSQGSLFITTQDYAFVKTMDVRSWGNDTIRTTSYYTPYNGNYYPYHLIRDGKSLASDNTTHWFHVELMASEILTESYEEFYGKEPNKFDLLKIPYDSSYWNNNTILKTTPLEDEIIRDLGSGTPLSEQFLQYQQYELSRIETAMKGEEGFNWFREDSKGKKVMLIGFWSSSCSPCLQEFERAKKILKEYGSALTIVLLSLDTDEKEWEKAILRYNLSMEGFRHFRIGDKSVVASHYQLTEIPRYILIDKNGNEHDLHAKHPGDTQLKNDFDLLIGGSNK